VDLNAGAPGSTSRGALFVEAVKPWHPGERFHSFRILLEARLYIRAEADTASEFPDSRVPPEGHEPWIVSGAGVAGVEPVEG